MPPGPTENTGEKSGRPVVGSGAATAGTMVGLALKVVMSTVSAPIRSWAEPKAELVRSIDNPVAVSVAKGAVVPVPVQFTTSVAGTVDSALTDCARKTGGGGPNGLLNTS